MSRDINFGELAEYYDFRKKLSDRIREIRLKKKKTQEDVAGLELTLRNYLRIEKGVVGPNIQSIFFICKNLEIQPVELFRDL